MNVKDKNPTQKANGAHPAPDYIEPPDQGGALRRRPVPASRLRGTLKPLTVTRNCRSLQKAISRFRLYGIRD